MGLARIVCLAYGHQWHIFSWRDVRCLRCNHPKSADPFQP
jgi:hypothetical protein